MDWSWTDIAGRSGLALSLFVFILTRIEHRKILGIHLECVSGEMSEKFKKEAGDYTETMLIIHVMNIGTRAIVIDKNSIKVIGPRETVSTYDCNWFGIDDIPLPLNPGEGFELGLFLDVFACAQGYQGYSKDVVQISIELSDIEGKTYKIKSRYEVLLELDDIRRSE